MSARIALLAFLLSCAGLDEPVATKHAELSHGPPRRLTATGPDTVRVVAGPTPGSRIIEVLSGNASVVGARRLPDGGVTTECVGAGE